MASVAYANNGRGAALNPEKLADRFAAFLNANPTITNDAALDAFVDGRTDAQVIAMCRVLLKAILQVVAVRPTGT